MEWDRLKEWKNKQNKKYNKEIKMEMKLRSSLKRHESKATRKLF